MDFATAMENQLRAAGVENARPQPLGERFELTARDLQALQNDINASLDRSAAAENKASHLAYTCATYCAKR